MAPKAASAGAKPTQPKSLDKTLDELKSFVRKHEMKIDDLAEDMKNEPNRTKRKEIENSLKKCQADEQYVKALADIKEAELQLLKDAERAAAAAGAGSGGAKGASGDAKKASAEVSAAGEAADEATMAEIDAALAGKDAAAKTAALAKLSACAASTPFVLPRVRALIPLFADSKLGAPAVKAACAIVSECRPKGHAIASAVMPALLAGMDDKKWKTKAGCIELLLPCLVQLEATPASLSDCLPMIVPKLAEAALEVRAEIRTATGAVLREIGSLVASAEIKKLSQDLVTALAEPTNQKHTQAVLAKMGNQTFLSLIDAASLALLMPVVVRGLKERDSASKKWSAQILGSTAMLVTDVEIIKPYLKAVLPLLKQALTDPVPEVQREVAKAFGVFEKVLPEISQQEHLPWLFSKLAGDAGEQIGASLALAEVFAKMDPARAAELMPEIERGAVSEKPSIRRGFMELMDATPQAMKMEFVPYIARLFPTMLMAITGGKEEDIGYRAAAALVARFGDLCPELLLPAFENVFAATMGGATPEAAQRNVTIREKATVLLGKVADKILEHKRFGQDLLTTEDCSTKEQRTYLLCLVFLVRADPDAAVKRAANGIWKTAGGAAKVEKAIMPDVEKMCLRLRGGEKGLALQKFATQFIQDLVKNGQLEAAPSDEVVAAAAFAFPPPAGLVEGSAASKIVEGKAPDAEVAVAAEKQGACSEDAAGEMVGAHACFASLPADVQRHGAEVARSVISEGVKKKLGGKKIVAGICAQLQEVISSAGAAAASEEELLKVSEAVARGIMGSTFDHLETSAVDDDSILLNVENLLLMYGAGHLLLKDTTLQMKKNSRYGVVGQNGAGKTTLMKEIANHRIVGMPAGLKCVHVDDSKLGLMSKSCLTTLEYTIKMAKDIGVHDASKDTLISVGFDEKMLTEAVADLSTGWRMRLTLAVSMLKNADLVLLDEPTNHLDEESVQWLSDYILSITEASVMVISHEPKFLDKICTHILAYVDKKLEYTEGNFQTFAAKKGLSQGQIEAMLSGNLSFDTKPEGEEGEDESAPGVSAPVAGPPKLSFPIPGSMEGVKSGSRAVLEAKNLSFRYAKDKDLLVDGVDLKLSLNSRVAICGRNGCGKSTLMSLLCSEMNPSEDKNGAFGDVQRHCNLRLGFMKQDHLNALAPFMDTSPFVYITTRFKDGYDGDLQKRLIEPEDADEALRRMNLAKEHGKYGNQVEELITRTKIGSQLAYEVKWAGLDDPKQNTVVPISKLRAMGLEKVVIACDERLAAKAAGLDQRPLTRREVIRHCEAFGIDEEMCCNRQIRGFSAGQKVRLSLAAMFWTKPHFIAVDEPTNYLDVETVEALAKALTNFRGGILMIEPKTDFVERICNEKWWLEDGKVTIEKLSNNAKRAA